MGGLKHLWLEGNPLAYAPFYRLDVLAWFDTPHLILDGHLSKSSESAAVAMRATGQVPLAWQIMAQYVSQQHLLWRPNEVQNQKCVLQSNCRSKFPYQCRRLGMCSKSLNGAQVKSADEILRSPYCRKADLWLSQMAIQGWHQKFWRTPSNSDSTSLQVQYRDAGSSISGQLAVEVK